MIIWEFMYRDFGELWDMDILIRKIMDIFIIISIEK